jgi:hypothetical protein
VTAAGTNAPQVANPFALNYNGTGSPTFNGGQPTSHAPPLSLAGFGTSNSPAAMRSMLELPPPPYAMGTPAAYSSAGLWYVANQADLVISNFVWGTNSGILPAGTNFIAYYQDSMTTPQLARLPYDFYVVTNATGQTIITNYVGGLALGGSGNTNIFYAGYTWLTNVYFYDWREGWNGGAGPPKKVQAVQIDMGRLNTWLTNQSGNAAYTSGFNSNMQKWLHSNHYIGGIYVYTSVPLTDSQLPAVRVTDGAILPNPYNLTTPYGVTVATPFPLYVWKDYNSATFQGSSLGLGTTTYTVPAALMGDSVTILSDNWNDSATARLPAPSSTTVNAAMITGIVPSDPSVSGSYSGGVENFMRLLEAWGGTLTFNGSIVVPFYSQFATNSWKPTGNYYNAPTRHWAYDLNFTNYSKLPPLTPLVENCVSP